MGSRLGIAAVAALIAGLVVCSAASAQGQDEWRWRVGTGGMLGDLTGEWIVGGFELPFEIDASDVVEHATGLNLNASASKGKDTYFLNICLLNLEDSGTTQPAGAASPVHLAVSFTQNLYEVGWDRNLWAGPLTSKPGPPTLINGSIGARVTTLDLDVDVDYAAVSHSGGFSESWVEPFVGVTAVIPLDRRWAFIAKGDYGGFGIGSEATWHALPSLVYTIDQHFSVTAGYGWFGLRNDDLGDRDATLDYQSKGPTFSVIYGW
ncbi:hypothetical protein LLH23_23685 [bacterium]|nr:hypothetical protein [bacterium]